MDVSHFNRFQQAVTDELFAQRAAADAEHRRGATLVVADVTHDAFEHRPLDLRHDEIEQPARIFAIERGKIRIHCIFYTTMQRPVVEVGELTDVGGGFSDGPAPLLHRLCRGRFGAAFFMRPVPARSWCRASSNDMRAGRRVFRAR